MTDRQTRKERREMDGWVGRGDQMGKGGSSPKTEDKEPKNDDMKRGQKCIAALLHQIVSREGKRDFCSGFEEV